MYWFPTFMDPERVERSYARTGHFDTINRANFELITESKVTKILLDDGAATGVSFEQRLGNNTTAITVKANKEVIIAAGAIHSPQLLQQSGIGPSALLEAAGIDTVVDLPGVGQNFQDHPMIFTNIIRKPLSSIPTIATSWNTHKDDISSKFQCSSKPNRYVLQSELFRLGSGGLEC